MKTLLEGLQSLISRTLKKCDGVPIEARHVEFSFPPKEFGDLSLNLAMKLSKELKKKPRELASVFVEVLEADADIQEIFSSIRVEGPGFINFTYSDNMVGRIVSTIREQKEHFGQNHFLAGKSILMEFVSANPTGPLTIAHARQAAVGDCLARVLSASGAKVHREYYNNDRGNQVTLLGKSVFCRYLEKFGKDVTFPEDGYQGDYIKIIADEMAEKYGRQKENLLAEEGAEFFKHEAAEKMLQQIIKDLADFRVQFDRFFSEKSLLSSDKIQTCLNDLKEKGHSYEQDGALWFASSRWKDDKDRVLIKTDGEYTYLTSDIAYHLDKLQRGVDLLVNLVGPDHHGYIPRMKAAVEALGYQPDQIQFLIIQLVTLYRGQEQLKMGKRSGVYVTLRELLEEVGTDAARYFFVRRKMDSPLDFDLELAKKQTPDNPVFYVQYASARISSMLKKALEKNPLYGRTDVSFDASCIGDAEKFLLKMICRFPEVVGEAAVHFEVHKVANFLEETAGFFQEYYSSGNKVISENVEMTVQKLIVCRCFQQVINNGLNLLGISIPERM